MRNEALPTRRDLWLALAEGLRKLVERAEGVASGPGSTPELNDELDRIGQSTITLFTMLRRRGLQLPNEKFSLSASLARILPNPDNHIQPKRAGLLQLYWRTLQITVAVQRPDVGANLTVGGQVEVSNSAAGATGDGIEVTMMQRDPERVRSAAREAVAILGCLRDWATQEHIRLGDSPEDSQCSPAASPSRSSLRSPRKPGRKQCFDPVQDEALYLSWQQANAAHGITQGEFERERGLEPRDLHRAADRIRSRKKRRTNAPD